MIEREVVTAVLVVAIGVVALPTAPPAGAQVAKGKSRAAATKFLMRGISQPACKGIADLLKESGPSEDKGWEAIACHASCLNELSFSLMQDGRCPDAAWAGAAKALGEGSSAVLTAAEKKDLEAVRSGFKSLTDSCKNCHDAHRKAK